MGTQIVGVGGYVPDKIRSNSDLELLVDTSSEWILSRTGIKERRILDDGLGTSDMIVKAIENLVAKTKLDIQSIDCLIVATCTPDMPMPSTASIVFSKLGVKNAFGFDVNSACTGFIHGMEVGQSLIESRKYKNVLVAGADKMSSVTDLYDRSTNILFGDGGGVVLLQYSEKETGIIDSIVEGNGEGKEFLNIKGGGSLHPVSLEVLCSRSNFLRQTGKIVFKNAVEKMTDVSKRILAKNNIKTKDVDWFAPHQANFRIIDSVGKNLEFEKEKVLCNISSYGNTSAASIPLCIWENEEKFTKNDILLLTAFGAGFNWGAMLIKWSY